MHCEPRGYEIDLRPAQPDKLGDPQPVPEAHQDRQCTAAAVPAALSRRLDQALDLRWRQILARTTTLDVWAATRRHPLAVTADEARYCSQNGGWHGFRSFVKG